MFRVGKVGCSGCIITKGNNETMSEIFIKAFRAVIGSPFNGNNTVNGLLELGELLLDLFNLNIGSIIFELQANNVANLKAIS
jgi:hypothetical protein